MLEKGIDFAVNVAPQIFTAAGKDVNKLKKMKDGAWGFCFFISNWGFQSHGGTPIAGLFIRENPFEG